MRRRACSFRVGPRWAAALVAASALVFVSCSGGSSESRPATDVLPEEHTSSESGLTSDQPFEEGFTGALDPATGDLCAWVTGDDVVEFLTFAGADVEGPVRLSERWPDDPFFGWACAWTLASGEEVQLGARSTSRASATQQLGMNSEYQEPGQVMDPGAGPISGHPDLSDGVLVENSAFGRFIFLTPHGERQLSVYISSVGESEVDETVLMVTADTILKELGWLDQ